jgi:hypothetical protein
VGLGRGLGERQAVDGGGAGEQVVVPGMGVLRQPLAVLGGGDDGSRVPPRSVTARAKIWSAPVGQAGQAGHVGRAFGESGAQSLVDQSRGWGGQAPVS